MTAPQQRDDRNVIGGARYFCSCELHHNGSDLFKTAVEDIRPLRPIFVSFTVAFRLFRHGGILRMKGSAWMRFEANFAAACAFFLAFVLVLRQRVWLLFLRARPHVLVVDATLYARK